MTANVRPTLRNLTAASFKVGCLGFGGPAGQIALMHRVFVEEKKWIESARDTVRAHSLATTRGEGKSPVPRPHMLAILSPDGRQSAVLPAKPRQRPGYDRVSAAPAHLLHS